MVFKKKKENVLIFDIGSASVGGSVVSLNSDEKPKILFSTRSQMAFQEELNFDHFVHSMLSVLLNVSMEMRSGGIPKLEGKIDRVLCVLSSPWYVSQTKEFHIQDEKPFKITEIMLSDFIKEVEEGHKKEAIQIEGNPVFIEKEIIQLKVNGYPVKNAVGALTTHIDVAVLSTIMSKDVHVKIKKMINKVFNVDDFIFKSFTSASYSVIIDLFYKEKNFLLVDVSGETTNISAVHDAVLRNSASFPLGHNFYKRSVQKENYENPEEAVSRIKIENDPEVTPVMLKTTLDNANKEWVDSFRASLVEVAKCTPLPSTLFLTGGAEYVDLLANTIQKADLSDILFVDTPFKISILDIKQLRPCCIFEADTHSDAFLTLSTIYMNRYIFASERA